MDYDQEEENGTFTLRIKSRSGKFNRFVSLNFSHKSKECRGHFPCHPNAFSHDRSERHFKIFIDTFTIIFCFDKSLPD